MSAVIEIRTYRAAPGCRDQLLRVLRERAFPLQRELGMRILGPFPSAEDGDAFVWLRAFPDEASREPLKQSFYDGATWLRELEPVAMPLLASYDAVLVVDDDDLWSRWPAA